MNGSDLTLDDVTCQPDIYTNHNTPRDCGHESPSALRDDVIISTAVDNVRYLHWRLCQTRKVINGLRRTTLPVYVIMKSLARLLH